jgi:hypothetical protein
MLAKKWSNNAQVVGVHSNKQVVKKSHSQTPTLMILATKLVTS